MKGTVPDLWYAIVHRTSSQTVSSRRLDLALFCNFSCTSLADHKLVIAHVYGHCDFLKNNCWFDRTNRRMIDEMANHGNRIRRYMDRFGVEAVEEFIDACLSIDDLIDLHSPFSRNRRMKW